MSDNKMQFEPPQPTETFFEALHKQGQRIDPTAPIIWIEHPPRSVLDRQGVKIFFKGNLRGNAAAVPWREEFPE